MFKSFMKRALKLRYLIPLVALILFISGAVCYKAAQKTFIIIADDTSNTYTSFAKTVQEALEDHQITLGNNDIVTPGLDTKLHEGDIITVERAKNISLQVDGEIRFLTVTSNHLSDVLKDEDIDLDDDDKISLDPSTLVYDNMDVKITRVYTRLVTEVQPVEYTQEVQKNSSLVNTKRYVSRGGYDGERTIKSLITYEDGVEIKREPVSSEITKEPVNEIVVQGTYPLMPVNSNGEVMNYSSVVTCRATAYWAIAGIGSTYTASGRLAVRDEEGYSTIAVDPSVFPYGTKLFIEGYGFAIAADTGSAIKGHKIDVYFNTYREACVWGAKYVKVYVIE